MPGRSLRGQPVRLTREWRHLLEGAIGVVGTRVFSMGLSFGSVYLITRGFGLAAMGILGLTRSIIEFVMVFAKAGLPTLLLKTNSAEKNPIKQHEHLVLFQRITFRISFITSVLLVAVAQPLATQVYHSPALIASLMMGAVAVPFLMHANISIAALNAVGHHRKAAWIQLVVPNASILIFTAAGIGLNVLYPFVPIIGLAMGWVLCCCLGHFLIRLQIPKAESPPPLASYAAWSHLKQSWPMALSNASFFLLTMTDTLMLGAYRNMEEVGIYRVITRLAVLCSFALPALNALSSPLISKLGKEHDIKALQAHLKRVRLMALGGSWIPFGVYAGFGHPILNLFGVDAGSHFSSLLFLGFGQSLICSFGMATPFLQMVGLQKQAGRNSGLAALVNVGANMLFIPRYGVFGAAIATQIGIMIWILGANQTMRNHYGFSYLTRWR